MTTATDSPAQPYEACAEPTPPHAAAPGLSKAAGQGAPSTRVLAIDPGSMESAYVVVDHVTRRPIRFGKVPNEQLLELLHVRAFDDCDVTAIEMVASYGMAVGADVFETCVWIGRFEQLARLHHRGPVDRVKRLPVKIHHCHDSKAKDSNIGQALVDRFAHGQTNHGKGTKTTPGWFYGFKADVWQAYALAVYVADTAISAPALPLPGAGAAQTPAARLEGEASERRDTTTTGAPF